MEPKRPVTRAARELSDRVRAAGVDVSPREIERWQHEHGLIESTDRREKRRWIPGGGSESSYGPGAEAQAKQVRALLDGGLDLADVVVVQWLRGYYVETAHLKRVLIAKIRERFGPPPNTADWSKAKPTADARAEHAAQKLARDEAAKQLRQALYQSGRRSGERINQTVARLVATILLVYSSGEPFTRNELDDVLKGLGVPPEFRNMKLIVEQLPNIQQGNLEKIVENATREQLDQAAKDRNPFASMATRIGIELAYQIPEHETVVQVIGVLAMRQALGENFQGVIDLLTNQDRK